MNLKRLIPLTLIAFCVVLFFTGKSHVSDFNKQRNIDPWISRLSDPDNNVRMGAARLLGKSGNKKATAYLIPLLSQDPNLWVRVEAAVALGNIKDPQAVEPLIKALKAKANSPPVRREAASALGKIGDKRAVEPLIERLDRDNNHLVIIRIIEALGAIKDRKAIEAITPHLKDQDAGIRKASTEALKNILGS